jgi:hypothetical protein
MAGMTFIYIVLMRSPMRYAPICLIRSPTFSRELSNAMMYAPTAGSAYNLFYLVLDSLKFIYCCIIGTGENGVETIHHQFQSYVRINHENCILV